MGLCSAEFRQRFVCLCFSFEIIVLLNYTLYSVLFGGFPKQFSTKVRFNLLSCFVFISFKFCIRVSGLWNFPGASFTSGAYLFPPLVRSICSQRDL